MTVPRCHICRHMEDLIPSRGGDPSLWFCADTIECNFRSRRRLGMPFLVCLEWKARDLETLATTIVVSADKTRGRVARILADGPPRATEEYRTHLSSSTWEIFANEQRLAARHRCEGCGQVSADLHVHHLTYERLGRERPEDVLVLCPICHQQWDEARRAFYRRAKTWRGARPEAIYEHLLTDDVRQNTRERRDNLAIAGAA